MPVVAQKSESPDADILQINGKTVARALKAWKKDGFISLPGADVERFVPSAVKLARGLKDYAVESSFKV
jgi:hypothetical protein